MVIAASALPTVNIASKKKVAVMGCLGAGVDVGPAGIERVGPVCYSHHRKLIGAARLPFQSRGRFTRQSDKPACRGSCAKTARCPALNTTRRQSRCTRPTAPHPEA